MSPFTILAEPNRRRLLDALIQGPMTVGELVDQSGMSQPAVSKHLRMLREGAFVSVEPDGQKRRYHLNREPFQSIDEWLQPHREFWAERLDALEQHLADRHASSHNKHGDNRGDDYE
ncbi:MAG: metalloregulator ArsR/SmtB family transcription factor [Pseudomonadota bacterium]